MTVTSDDHPVDQFPRLSRGRGDDLTATNGRLYFLNACDLKEEQSRKVELEVYQFIWCSSFNGAAVVRVARHNNGISLRWAKSWEMMPPPLTLSQDDWAKLLSALTTAGFWELETAGTNIGFDGANWLIEGARDDRNHSIERWSPRGAIYELGSLFFALAGKPLADVRLY